MKCLVRWHIAQSDVTTITSMDAVDALLSRAPRLTEPPEGARVFVSGGSGSVEIAAGCAMHRRVAIAAALQNQLDHTAV